MRSLFGLRPGQGGRTAPLDPPCRVGLVSDPVKYVTIPKQTVVRIAIACMAVGFALGLLLAFLMLVDGPC